MVLVSVNETKLKNQSTILLYNYDKSYFFILLAFGLPFLWPLCPASQIGFGAVNKKNIFNLHDMNQSKILKYGQYGSYNFSLYQIVLHNTYRKTVYTFISFKLIIWAILLLYVCSSLSKKSIISYQNTSLHHPPIKLTVYFYKAIIKIINLQFFLHLIKVIILCNLA